MSLISPNFDVKSIIFFQIWPGAFPKLLEKALWFAEVSKGVSRTKRLNTVFLTCFTYRCKSGIIVIGKLYTHFLGFVLTSLLYPLSPFVLYNRMPGIPNTSRKLTLVMTPC